MPILAEPRSKAEIQRYKKKVQEYCAREFAHGATVTQVSRRLRRVNSKWVVTLWVRREHLIFLGVSPAQIDGARYFSYGFGVVAVIAAALQLSPSPSSLEAWHVLAALAAALLIGFVLESAVRAFWILSRGRKIDIEPHEEAATNPLESTLPR